jgi:hypothetical protein
MNRDDGLCWISLFGFVVLFALALRALIDPNPNWLLKMLSWSSGMRRIQNAADEYQRKIRAVH